MLGNNVVLIVEADVARRSQYIENVRRDGGAHLLASTIDEALRVAEITPVLTFLCINGLYHHRGEGVEYLKKLKARAGTS